ncbi:ABC transporter permease [Enterococcus italicus]|uniref:ABC transporter permease n=1 Tax=Enterococcus italicus TaxID=246144 RepID=UPI0028A941F4|nr:ABC transporter permease [Enterococcus italicus]
MTRFIAIVTRVFKELMRDKRTLALMMVAPMLVLFLMNVVFNSTTDSKVIIGVEQVPLSWEKAFPTDKVTVKKIHDESAKDAILNQNLDAVITVKNDVVKVTYKNEDASKTAQIKNLIEHLLASQTNQTMSKELQILAKKANTSVQIPTYQIQAAYIYGDGNQTFFDKIIPVLIGFFVFFFVFLISGIALLRERTSGTLERLLATPIRRTELVLGYMTGYGIFAIFQTILIVLFSIFILKVDVIGNIGWVVFINSLIALTALVMGLFISTFANSEFQMMQFIPLVVVPQVFFSGLLSLDSMAPWVRNVAYIFPLCYGGDALTAIIIRGQGWSAIWQDSIILLGFISVFTVLNVWGLRRYRKV